MSDFPLLLPLGVDGLLVRFSDKVSDDANAAVLALKQELEGASVPGVREIAPALSSLAVFFDPLHVDPLEMEARISTILAGRDWTGLTAPRGRHWQIPVTFGEEHGPQLAEVAQKLGKSIDETVAELCSTELRVLALGFAPGQPYLGILPEPWNIPRQTGLTPQVPMGAVIVAVRQVVIFATSAPTGWWQVGWTGFRPFDQRGETQLHFSPSDLVSFVARPASEVLDQAEAPLGGAVILP